MFSVNSWSRAFSDDRERTLPSRDPVDVTSPAWRSRYGDIKWSDTVPRRHYLRHNVIMGGQAPVWLWGPGRCELVSEYNQFLPAGTDLSGTGYGRMVGGADVHGILEGIDPLPKESDLGVRAAAAERSVARHIREGVTVTANHTSAEQDLPDGMKPLAPYAVRIEENGK